MSITDPTFLRKNGFGFLYTCIYRSKILYIDIYIKLYINEYVYKIQEFLVLLKSQTCMMVTLARRRVKLGPISFVNHHCKPNCRHFIGVEAKTVCFVRLDVIKKAEGVKSPLLTQEMGNLMISTSQKVANVFENYATT